MPRECSRYSPFIIVEKISQAEVDSLTIGQLGISRGGPPIERAVSAPDVGIGSRPCENVFPPPKAARNQSRSTLTQPFEHIFAVASLESTLAQPRATLSELNGQMAHTTAMISSKAAFMP
jgi:hypothetical protein